MLGFLNDDPRDPIVLGMLNSSNKPAPLKAQDENHQKGFFTRSQMKVTFDDDKKIITLETPGGNKITISDDAKGITLQDQTGNKLVMDETGILIKSPKDITIEATGKLTLKATQDTKIEGLNVNVKANSQFKAEGNAGAEVSTSAIAILKGRLSKSINRLNPLRRNPWENPLHDSLICMSVQWSRPVCLLFPMWVDR